MSQGGPSGARGGPTRRAALATSRKHRKELAIKTAIVLFTRDLRVRDNPALATACEQADLVVPLFAVDARLMSAAPNRARFLLESLADLHESLRSRGGDLMVRHGSAEAEVIRLATQTGAQTVFVAGDFSRYAGSGDRAPGLHADQRWTHECRPSTCRSEEHRAENYPHRNGVGGISMVAANNDLRRLLEDTFAHGEAANAACQ